MPDEAATSRWWGWETWVAILATLASAGLAVTTRIPLGWPGEWVWNRVAFPSWERFVSPAFAISLFFAVAYFGSRVISKASRTLALLLLGLLLASGGLLQWAWLETPPPPRGPERYAAALYYPGPSGYLLEARGIVDSRQFLSDFPSWIAKQDSFHIGTHPPGLFLINRWLLNLFEVSPGLGQWLLRSSPERVTRGLAALGKANLDGPTKAAIVAWPWISLAATLIAAAAVFGIGQMLVGPEAGWLAAGFWLVAPGPVLFLPTADTLYPALAALATLLGLIASRRRSLLLGIAAGIVCFAGLLATLAFLVVGFLIAGAMGLELARSGVGTSWTGFRPALGLFLGVAMGIAFLALGWGVNIVEIWRINLGKHAGFYVAMPRTYGVWVWFNLAEFAISVGPAPATLALIAGVRGLKKVWVSPASAFASMTALTILALDASGRNLSEVGRLWLLLGPMTCAAAALDAPRRQGRWRALLAQAIVTTIWMAAVEPLLPVAVE